MANYITIDGGTTNTRITLVRDYKVVDTFEFNVGAAVGCENNQLLKSVIKQGIGDILLNNNIQEQDIERILASGMITSEGGLLCLDHITAPCGIEELSNALYEVVIEDISKVPFVFVRGIKTDGENLDEIDMIRGEETEIMGISRNPEKDCLYVLPGSHSKLIYTDEHKRICKFTTELTGELISAVLCNTLLKNSIDFENCEIDKDYLQKGYTYSKENGINAALFKVRVLDKLLHCRKYEVFSFFIGCALQNEVDNIIKSNANKIIIGGKKELKTPTAILVRKNSDKKVVEIPENITAYATAYGAINIYEYRKNKSHQS